MEIVDVAIVGGGPAGSTCAAFCAAAGLRTVLVEREKFPREKVCGDCINPACWPVLRRLAVLEHVRALPYGKLDRVEFIAIGGQKVIVDLPSGDESEIAIKRSLLDNLLLSRARELGAEIHEQSIVTALSKTASRNWKIDIVTQTFGARFLVGADGRNSTVARLCNLLPRPERERVALQAHIPLPRDFGNRVVLQFLPEGYSGQAPVNEAELNLCLVGTPPTISSLRKWAERHFEIGSDQPWRTITPLTRAPIPSTQENLFFIGDAARVVEPFTGEGIYYALRSGELAANAIVKIVRGQDRQATLREFCRAHADMYRGRLWINRLARAAVLSPRIASSFVHVARIRPSILRLLTRKIVADTL
ncbi:MAG TPA: NAD(P)/FAD-dependent oxidoreductase [Chthoniobacterales bacterium]|nr:NAD(P)/FAD-dependent oxidoreductase [Chthoniobacterales bacterium]